MFFEKVSLFVNIILIERNVLLFFVKSTTLLRAFFYGHKILNYLINQKLSLCENFEYAYIDLKVLFLRKICCINIA